MRDRTSFLDGTVVVTGLLALNGGHGDDALLCGTWLDWLLPIPSGRADVVPGTAHHYTARRLSCSMRDQAPWCRPRSKTSHRPCRRSTSCPRSPPHQGKAPPGRCTLAGHRGHRHVRRDSCRVPSQRPGLRTPPLRPPRLHHQSSSRIPWFRLLAHSLGRLVWQSWGIGRDEKWITAGRSGGDDHFLSGAKEETVDPTTPSRLDEGRPRGRPRQELPAAPELPRTIRFKRLAPSSASLGRALSQASRPLGKKKCRQPPKIQAPLSCHHRF